ncbi:AzlC family ABC transporter permease [Corynebacterium sp. TA-R-1]|uniref:AzlC family ABC transporter permease n=1 Tax=Corynebacterium stercoris TaxID=2943490 RepID=A0ABT1G389_9CORY|nr:AzlC family ABC transporter permease [Corynebacterium stercoris]MCP1388455.1 AzlC family ABC transporter permease [Corynebacterium stercoris]
MAEVRLGLQDAWVVSLGLVPLGLAFGLLMTQAGFAWWWTPIFSTVIFAGSMEFLALDLVLAGASVWTAALTTFMVNFRHIFYGLTFPRHILRPGLQTAYATYALTDEAYATYALTDEAYAVGSAAHARVKLTPPRLLTIIGFIQISWILAGIVGAVAGYVLPPDLEGLDFALTALFAGLAWDSFQSANDYSAPLIAGMLALIAAVLVPGQMVIVALLAYFAVLLARFWSPKLDSLLTWRHRR